MSLAIQFTVEQETDNQLLFLDVLVMSNEDEELKTTVPRKEIHKDVSPGDLGVSEALHFNGL